MKAVVYERYGTPDDLELREVEEPTPADDEVLVEVRAASLNSWDWDLLRGEPWIVRVDGLFKPKRNILGCDIAGEVEAVGSGVTDLAPGDQVFGDISGCGWGGFAERVCARADLLARKSERMSFEQAAALPQAGVLALQGLYGRRPIEPGHEILLNGAGGGVGTLGLQTARADGAEVTAVDRADKLELLRSLGADHVVDYAEQDYTRTGRRYDLILDVVAHRSFFDYKRALKPGGIFAFVGGSMSLMLPILTLGPLVSLTSNKKLAVVVHRPNRGDLDRLTALFEDGVIEPVIDRVFELADTAEAFRYFGEGSFKGKIVIEVS